MFQFFSIIVILIIVFVAFIIFMIIRPIAKFMKKALAVIRLYEILQNLLQQDLLNDHDLEISYDNYTISFSSAEEAYTELEKLATDALNCYDKLGWLATEYGDFFKEEKYQLINICADIRTTRWRKQGS